MAAVRQANENASVVMILPDWPDRPWYRLAHKHFARVFTFKTGVCLFGRQHKGPGPARWYCAPSQWPVTVYAKLSCASEKSLSALLERELGAFQMQHTGLIDEHYGLDCTTGLHTQHGKTFTDTGNVKLALGNQQDDALHTDATARMHAITTCMSTTVLLNPYLLASMVVPVYRTWKVGTTVPTPIILHQKSCRHNRVLQTSRQSTTVLTQ